MHTPALDRNQAEPEVGPCLVQSIDVAALPTTMHNVCGVTFSFDEDMRLPRTPSRAIRGVIRWTAAMLTGLLP